ncbi:amino acid--tRNA ligase-related protein, partial [Candidatus Cardinium hertigii]|uniref:amino acid--tRNA ligase-related protein n=1 Tax=Candidatus Cardinium hertigii TaxID=247481 RepID=UPI001617ABCB
MYPLSAIPNLSVLNHQEIIRIRGRVFAKKDCGRLLFVILRDGIHTLQAIAIKPKEGCSTSLSIEDYHILRKIENESFIEIMGQVCAAKTAVLACSQQSIELEIMGYTILSRSVLDLPITLKEASLTEEKRHAHPFLPSIQYCKRLDNRVLDLRTNLSQAIFRINDGMLFYLQKYLRKQGFLEIKTSKLIGSASEGGANLFKLDYFGQTACLAQSPQLYKQMAIMGDFKRVFEIGPVFRAENSNSNRHLTEFIGVDIEMVIDKDYMEVVELLYRMFVYVFDKLHQKYHHEIAIIQSFFDFPTITLSSALVVLTFSDAIALLKAHSIEIGDLDDFSTEDEKRLGAIVREKYKTDLFVVTQYPANVRPFYTMPDPKDSR